MGAKNSEFQGKKQKKKEKSRLEKCIEGQAFLLLLLLKPIHFSMRTIYTYRSTLLFLINVLLYKSNGCYFRELESTLQMFTGIYGVPVSFFSAISMEKGCKNHRKTLYSSKGKILYVVIFTDCRENPMITIGFPCNL